MFFTHLGEKRAMINTKCSKRVADMKNWIKTLILKNVHFVGFHYKIYHNPRYKNIKYTWINHKHIIYVLYLIYILNKYFKT